MPTITVYSTPTCVYCNMAKNFFKANGFAYQDFNVATDLEKRKEMIDKTGQMGVPVIDIGGTVVVGFDEAKIRTTLGIK
jgi:glutaredoxin 3